MSEDHLVFSPPGRDRDMISSRSGSRGATATISTPKASLSEEGLIPIVDRAPTCAAAMPVTAIAAAALQEGANNFIDEVSKLMMVAT